MSPAAILFAAVGLLVPAAILLALRRRRRRIYIDSYRFPVRVADAVRRRYPSLDDAGVKTVLRGLREYFHVCRAAGRRQVAMPSQAVDVAWHEFILFTRAYQQFCNDALGRFLHHTPAEAMRSPTDAQEGIKRAWRISCAREGIHPKHPATLPLLFAIDAQLGIADGFRYVPDCTQMVARSADAGGAHCGSHIGCSSGCSGGSGSGDSDGSDGGGGGCGGD